MIAMAMDSETGTAELDQLTLFAREAAEQGRWDLVDEWYRARGAAMQGASLTPQDAERMLAIDRQIQEQAITAKAALAELLRESFAVRLRLAKLRHVVGEGRTVTGTIGVDA